MTSIWTYIQTIIQILPLFILMSSTNMIIEPIDVLFQFKVAALRIPYFSFWNIDYSFDMNKPLNCLPCNYTATNYNANSKKEDVMLVYASKSTHNLMAFLRTLRHTGSKCTTIIFVDEEARLSIGDKELKYLEDCGAQLINIHSRLIFDEGGIFTEVYYHIYRFLMLHRHKINRVIKLDMYDTLFQGDPFDIHMPTGALQMVPERSILHYPFWGTVKECYIPQKVKTLDAICAGYFAGDAEVVYDFLRYYLENRPTGTHDQGCINGWYYDGLFEKAGIKVLSQPNSTVLHMWTLGRKGREFGDIRTGYEPYHIATIIHHTHHYCYTVKSVENKYCPPPYPNFPHYSVKCKNDFQK